MDQGKTGITKLLQVEAEAADLVKEAREYRTVKLRQAKDAAEQAIKDFSQGLHKEFLDKTNALGSLESFSKDLNEQSAKELALIEKEFNANKEQVIELLVGVVTSVKVEVNKDYAESLQALAK